MQNLYRQNPAIDGGPTGGNGWVADDSGPSTNNGTPRGWPNQNGIWDEPVPGGFPGGDFIRHYPDGTSQFHGNKCLSPHTKISMLGGERKRVVNHRVLKIKFDDGTVIEVSGNHPTADGRLLNDLIVGDIVDGRKVKSIKQIKYKYKYTYDILPDSETGNYYANGILIGSTLSESIVQPNISEFALVGV